jgi:hypothetical protein
MDYDTLNNGPLRLLTLTNAKDVWPPHFNFTQGVNLQIISMD